MGWVDGKPKMISERYGGHAGRYRGAAGRPRGADAARADPAPGFRGGGRGVGAAGRSGRGRHHRPGGWGRAAGAAAVAGHLPRAGRAEPGRGSLLQAGVRGLVAHHGGGPVHQDRCLGAGSPPVLGRHARRAAGGAAADRGEAGAGGVRPVRAGHQLGGAGHDELRDVHRYRQRQGTSCAAGQGQAETHRPAAGGLGLVVTQDGGIPLLSHRLPKKQARCHPVPGDDHDAGRPARRPGRRGQAGRHRDDRRLRRRAELRSQLRAAGRHEPALRGLGARQRLPRPARPARRRPFRRR